MHSPRKLNAPFYPLAIHVGTKVDVGDLRDPKPVKRSGNLLSRISISSPTGCRGSRTNPSIAASAAAPITPRRMNCRRSIVTLSSLAHE